MTTLHPPPPTPPTPGAPAPGVSTGRMMWNIVSYRPALFVANLLLWAGFHLLPVVFAYLVGQLFERLGALEAQGSDDALLRAAWVVVGLFALARVARLAVFRLAFGVFVQQWLLLDALLRHNLLSYILLAQGARVLPDTPAEAVSRFRDDVDDVALYRESWVDALGMALYVGSALFLMWRADPTITAVVALPTALMIGLVAYLSPRIRTYRRRMREATARVTDFVGETFGAVGAVKLAGAEAQITEHLRELGEVRRRAALRDVLLTELIRGVNANMVNLGIGLTLLLGATALLTGRLSVGEFVLFAALLPRLSGSMAFFGDMLAQHRRTGVAFDRMARLLGDAPPLAPVAHTPLPLEEHDLPPPPLPAEGAVAAPLRELRAEGLSVRYPGGGGIEGVSFVLRPGEFVVVTGRIGAGKSTLLRAVLGLTPLSSGAVYWNGERVDDPAHFFTPPRSAYAAQLPQLFSGTLSENVLLGERRERLPGAIHTAVMEPDVAALDGGLQARVGNRGVKLSGGQLQRSAVARMLARDAELLVFDDVSSALDAQTEAQLWERLFAARESACLVVSHRRTALRRADRILYLEGGRVLAQGTLSELLESSPQLRALWEGEEDAAR